MKWVFVITVSTIYFLTFFIVPTILEDGDQYLIMYDSFKNDLADTFFGDPVTNTDAYIVNTYYYPKSKSLGENALAMVLLMNRNTMRDITKYKMHLVATNGSGYSVDIVPKIVVESYSGCAYVNVVATTNSLPNLSKLEITTGETRMQIPFRHARKTAPAPVVICISPQFISEQWQIFVAHAHISRHFGGHLHLYITSILDQYFDLIKEYEKQGYVTIDYWMRMKFERNLNSTEPNSNVEWRNQAGAHTDCLLQYKEAASFVTFFDLDDILIPRRFNTYFDEFSSFFFLNPEIATLQYPKREMMLHNKPNMSDMNFQEIFGHSWFVNREDAGKIVARPSSLNSMWIHRSFNVPDKKLHLVKNNFLLHMQKPFDTDGQDSVPFGMSNYEMMDDLKLNISILEPIQKDFEKLMNSTVVQSISERLPTHSYYFVILFRCYYKKGYMSTCPNSEGCLIPQRSDMKCVHSDANYKSGPQMEPITYHYHENPRWSKDIGCYT
ncbi:hypothetical protein CRE_18772 [Caenorhabditis remanei]|uniref:Glycosyltransferase family 92 protein n=1 Tax=Caenorhabditis remanei TaxID=31234 RepID=E3LK47_CAERE|nr:hypothetical protein CRE_18772 [Caenorhabditis remanei]